MKTRCVNLKDFEARGLLDGSISTLWRPVKPQPPDDLPLHGWITSADLDRDGLYSWYDRPSISRQHCVKCPWESGDVLIGREKFFIDHIDFAWGGKLPERPTDEIKEMIYYRADGTCCQQMGECACSEVGKPRWRSSTQMPQWASRIRRELVAVECRQVQSVTEGEARASGASPCFWFSHINGFANTMERAYPGTWDRNDWYWLLKVKEAE